MHLGEGARKRTGVRGLGRNRTADTRIFRTGASLRIPLIVIAGSGIVITCSGDRDHSVGAKRR